jgi:hypothetical protein
LFGLFVCLLLFFGFARIFFLHCIAFGIALILTF